MTALTSAIDIDNMPALKPCRIGPNILKHLRKPPTRLYGAFKQIFKDFAFYSNMVEKTIEEGRITLTLVYCMGKSCIDM